MYAKFFKRIMDLICASLAIIILSPLFLIIAILVRINLGSPILFRQQRVGKDERIFMMYKFRTMTNECDECGKLLSSEQRLNRFGKFLRSSSLDELPEMFNIIKGDLSFVGPRPLLVEYLPHYTDYEHQRHIVRVGLIPPEVLYNNITPTWEEQFKYEVDYANNISLILDLRILIATFNGVIKRNNSGYGGYLRKSLIHERLCDIEKTEAME